MRKYELLSHDNEVIESVEAEVVKQPKKKYDTEIIIGIILLILIAGVFIYMNFKNKQDGNDSGK